MRLVHCERLRKLPGRAVEQDDSDAPYPCASHRTEKPPPEMQAGLRGGTPMPKRKRAVRLTENGRSLGVNAVGRLGGINRRGGPASRCSPVSTDPRLGSIPRSPRLVATRSRAYSRPSTASAVPARRSPSRDSALRASSPACGFPVPGTRPRSCRCVRVAGRPPLQMHDSDGFPWTLVRVAPVLHNAYLVLPVNVSC